MTTAPPRGTPGSTCRTPTPNGGNQGDAAFVPMDKITGRAIMIVWPAGRWGKLGVPDTFKAVPAPGPAPDKPSISLTATTQVSEPPVPLPPSPPAPATPSNSPHPAADLLPA